MIVNPLKVFDWAAFRRHIEFEAKGHGYAAPIWLETTADDPGHAMTQTAVRLNADLVLGIGGDGTVRAICAGLATTGIAFGLIPAGTGNLLAKNLGIPLDERDALRTAFAGSVRAIDLIRLTADDGEPEWFTVMGGIGIDAAILADINAELKKAVGSAAYFIAAAKHAGHPPTWATITIDDKTPIRRKATVIVIGNVGYLQANIPLIPDARPDDGLLDLLIASPRTPAEWVRVTARVLRRGRRTDERLDRFTARKVVIDVARPDEYELDGDPAGTASHLVAEVVPGALTIRVP